jgi:uncharacterized protein YbbC (DUF1343 family)
MSWRRSFLVAALLALPTAAQARVETGLDVLVQTGFKTLQGRRVALITNQTGVDIHGESDVDLLRKARGVRLVAVLSPEHGFRGDVADGVHIANTTDPVSGLPVFALYGDSYRPTDAMLKNVDTIVFDIQDIGTRFYTYITTMGMALEEASKRHIRFVVLDRPNPVRGDIIEGDVLDSDIRRMTGYFEIPVRHGMTVGEIARWMNKTRHLNAELEIVKMRKWKRADWYTETGLPFVPPSPNIPRPQTALLYAGIGCFEATGISVGRGTDTPFEVFGAPGIDGKGLAAHLREQDFPGVLFEPVVFTPKKDAHAGQVCEGVRLIVTDRNTFRPFDVFVTAFLYLNRTSPDILKPEWEEVRVVTGSNRLKEAAAGNWRLDDLLDYYHDRSEEFSKAVAPFRLY